MTVFHPVTQISYFHAFRPTGTEKQVPFQFALFRGHVMVTCCRTEQVMSNKSMTVNRHSAINFPRHGTKARQSQLDLILTKIHFTLSYVTLYHNQKDTCDILYRNTF